MHLPEDGCCCYDLYCRSVTRHQHSTPACGSSGRSAWMVKRMKVCIQSKTKQLYASGPVFLFSSENLIVSSVYIHVSCCLEMQGGDEVHGKRVAKGINKRLSLGSDSYNSYSARFLFLSGRRSETCSHMQHEELMSEVSVCIY
ncbi:hypothetical protein ATANTOWER_015344 [Ataeniobius toweri]|uniref:Uncharacterized protein n=1 Tax=Ataeniobius toweri TaxID=208326 RepID=A0ABU7AAE0_9TELE|nr:hypothetical protein [Ataeniobius toweri]